MLKKYSGYRLDSNSHFFKQLTDDFFSFLFFFWITQMRVFNNKKLLVFQHNNKKFTWRVLIKWRLSTSPDSSHFCFFMIFCCNLCTWHMMHGYTLMVPMNQRVHSKLSNECELPQSHCGDNWEDTLFWCLHIYYAHLTSVRFEGTACRGWFMNTYITLFTQLFEHFLVLWDQQFVTVYHVPKCMSFPQSHWYPGGLVVFMTTYILRPLPHLYKYIQVYIQIYIHSKHVQNVSQTTIWNFSEKWLL